jgi:hypothetical protein
VALNAVALAFFRVPGRWGILRRYADGVTLATGERFTRSELAAMLSG